MSDVEAALLREIRDTLKSVEAKLTPQPTKAAYKLNLGRTFAIGQLIPDDVDLVMGAGGLRWIREYGTDEWHPRDVEGPVISSNELLSRTVHVTEIPAPKDDGQ